MSLFTKKHIPFFIVLVLCFTPLLQSPSALILGLILSQLGLVPTHLPIAKWTKKLLSYSIIGLGFGISLAEAFKATSSGIGLIMTTIFVTLLLGTWVAIKLGIDKKTGYLISSGTAICGGSAIAAVSPAINANANQTGLALATVFILNSIALFVFPVIGHALNLDQHTFGVWAAIAIHDTSSVVGAASAYGEEALRTATTLKLARALWIIPVTIGSAWYFGRGKEHKIKVPTFIFLYIAAVVISDLLPQFDAFYHMTFSVAKQTLVACLFLIGSAISLEQVKEAGVKPLLFGVGLWLTISVGTLLWLLH
ncbi:YeiH family protein [Vibrio sp. B1Z05]|uniref:YeiH family protein n=1 Tax=Vibrio sp. B1Z05 TaxID=2654980 RepID=UPI00128C3447|nr:putative sulfate exporter family transporter [Vibrio sp. B1Z05]MPW37136.1 putative sulfate exporter family transporter [Vibrio sp. B1Z05]